MPKWIAQKWHKYTIALFLGFMIYLFFVFFESKELGLLGLLFFLFLFVIHERLSRWLSQAFAQMIHTVQERIKHQGVQALERMPFGVLIINQDDTIEWYNSFVQTLIGKKSLLGKKLKDVFPDLDLAHSELELNGRTYRLIKQDENLYLINDITELVELNKKLHDDRVIFGFLHIDNIDEASHGLSEQDYTLLLSQVVSLITQWAQEYHMSIKRLDTDKFVFITEQRSLERLIKTRFEILDQVRGLTGNHRIPITLSIGLSGTGNNMMERSQNAQAALDIALARGGDQVAIRDGERLTFIGGKTNAVEKRTRVRARVISQSMANLFRDHSNVIIMGHKLPDLDSIGSAVGIARFAMIYDCDPYIIMDETNPSIEKLIKELAKNKLWRSRLITPDLISLILYWLWWIRISPRWQSSRASLRKRNPLSSLTIIAVEKTLLKMR
jgi:c-di-AMP phosphodiesterase-like protein